MGIRSVTRGAGRFGTARGRHAAVLSLGALACAMLCSLAFGPEPAIADEAVAGNPGASAGATVASEKAETVYLFARPDGSVKSTEVATTLRNPGGAERLADASALHGIENTGSDGAFEGAGDQMVWDARGADVHYLGTSEKQAPVALRVEYLLDGEPVSAAEVAGATGRVTMRFAYETTASADTGGAKVPFTFITAMILDDGEFANIEVDNGKLVDDGDRTIVVGFGIPSLAESIGGIAGGFDIPDHFEVSADVDGFEMGPTLTVASAGILADLDFDALDLGGLGDAAGELESAMEQLVTGAGALDDGLAELADGAARADAAGDRLAKGARDVAAGASTIDGAVGTADDTATDGTLLGGMNAIRAGYDGKLLPVVRENVQKAVAILSDHKTIIAVAWDALKGMDKAIDGLGATIDSLGAIDTSDLSALGSRLTGLRSKLDAAKSSIAKAQRMLETLGSLDMSGVESGLASVGGSMSSAGSHVQAAGASMSSAANDLTGEGGAAGLATAAGSDVSQAGQAIGGVLASMSDEEKARYGEALQGALGSLQGAGGDLDALGGKLGSAGASLSAGVGELQSAGGDLQAGGDTLGTVGSSLQTLEDSLPGESDIAAINALLADAGTSLSDENIAVMDQCIDALGSSLGKLDLDELNAEAALLKQYYPKAVEYLKSTGADQAAKELQAKLDALLEGMEQVSGGLADERAGLVQLGEGAGKLASGADALSAAMDAYDDGIGELAGGAGAAHEGATALADGLRRFDDEGISAIVDVIEEVLPVADTLDEAVSAARAYDNFSGITEGTSGSVRFVIETDEISAAS
ncbi:MAG: hypothetical protein ACOYIP_00175 [Coriobacteriales bacterium]|jgi:putative membrane protein